MQFYFTIKSYGLFYFKNRNFRHKNSNKTRTFYLDSKIQIFSHNS